MLPARNVKAYLPAMLCIAMQAGLLQGGELAVPVPGRPRGRMFE